MTDRVLVGNAPPPSQAQRAPVSSHAPWSLVLFAGLTLSVVGWLDVALVFVPPNWASLEWEIGTIAAVFDGLPLGTLGIALVGAGLVGRGSMGLVRVLAWVVWAVLLGLVVMTVILALDAVPALRFVNPQVAQLLKKALLKTSLMAVVYIAFYVVTGRWLWRVSRVSKGVSS